MYEERPQMKRVGIYALLLLVSLFFLAPFYWMLTMALKDYIGATSNPPTLLPHPFVWNWKPMIDCATSEHFWAWIRNSIILSVVPTATTVIFSALPAYAFARLRAKGKNTLFAIIIGTMMLPSICAFIPSYAFWFRLGGINTFWPFLLPPFFGNAFFIFLFRQFFASLPVELEEAAIMDGCGRLRFFAKVLMPLSGPAIATVAIMAFQGAWTDYAGPAFFLNSITKWTMAVGLAQGFVNQYSIVAYNLVAFAAILFSLPLLVVYFFGQRYFIQGIVTTGLKR